MNHPHSQFIWKHWKDDTNNFVLSKKIAVRENIKINMKLQKMYITLSQLYKWLHEEKPFRKKWQIIHLVFLNVRTISKWCFIKLFYKC